MGDKEVKEDVLVEAGLSINEAKVYLSLLEIGCTTATKISKKSNIHRTNVYESLERLQEKGIAAHIVKDEVAYYEATEPENLINLLKEKENRLLGILPQLKLLRNFSESKGEASLYKGVKAFKNILYSYLNYKQPIMVFGIPKDAVQTIGPWINVFHSERIKKKIEIKHLYNENAKERIRFLNSLEYTYGKYLPSKYNSPATTNICGEEISLVVWSKEPLIICIKNKEIAQAYKRYFELLWSIAKVP